MCRRSIHIHAYTHTHTRTQDTDADTVDVTAGGFKLANSRTALSSIPEEKRIYRLTEIQRVISFRCYCTRHFASSSRRIYTTLFSFSTVLSRSPDRGSNVILISDSVPRNNRDVRVTANLKPLQATLLNIETWQRTLFSLRGVFLFPAFDKFFTNPNRNSKE